MTQQQKNHPEGESHKPADEEFGVPEAWWKPNHAGPFEWTEARQRWALDMWHAGVWWALYPMQYRATPPILPGAALGALLEGEPPQNMKRYSFEEPDGFLGIAIDHPLAHSDLREWAFPMIPSQERLPVGIVRLDLILTQADLLCKVHDALCNEPSHPLSGVGQAPAKVAAMQRFEIEGTAYHTLAAHPAVWLSRDVPPPLTFFCICGALAVELRYRLERVKMALESQDDAPAIREFAIRARHPVAWTDADWTLLKSLRREFDRYKSRFLLPPPPLYKPDGWTRGELINQAHAFNVSLSPSTFDNIRKAAGIKPSERGGRGAQRRYSIAELRKLIRTAKTGRFRNGPHIASAWADLLP